MSSEEWGILLDFDGTLTKPAFDWEAMKNEMAIEDGTMILEYIETAPPEQRALRGERTWAVATAPCGSLFQIPIEYTSGRRLPSEIISLPVAPDDPGAAMQTFSICAIADNTLVERPSIAPGHIPMSQEYRFIDIGAGIPDPSEGLGGDSHLTL